MNTTTTESKTQAIDTTMTPFTGNTSSTTIKSSTASTTTISTATSDMNLSSPNSPTKSNKPAIIGGVIGGILCVAVVIVAVVVVFRWRRRSKKRNSREPVLPPHKEHLEQFERERALKAAQQNQPGLQTANTNVDAGVPQLYVNTDGTTVDMFNYPAVAPDGYMIKGYGVQVPAPNKSKKKRRKKGNKKEVQDSGNVRSSMPVERAPSIPHSSQNQVKSTIEDANFHVDTRLSETGSQYALGGIATVPDPEKPVAKYVNLGPQKKGEAVFGVMPRSTAKSTPISNRAKTKHTQPDKDKSVSETITALDVSSGANTYVNDPKPYANVDHLGNQQYYNEGAILGREKELVDEAVYEEN